MANVFYEVIIMFEIFGEVELSKFLSNPRNDYLAEKYKRGIITPMERKELMKSRTFVHKQPNLLMNRFFDRLCSAFSQAPDRFAQTLLTSWQGIDSHSYQNTQTDTIRVGAGIYAPVSVSADAFELVPGLIGLGYGGSNLDVDVNNRGLDSPFPHDVITPLPYNYRNTYNTKEEGTAPISTNRDYFILRCGAHWESTWESRDGGPLLDIDEVGLFMNSILAGRYIWAVPPGNPTIDITQGIAPPSNKAFEILNITAYGGGPALLVHGHDDLGGGGPNVHHRYSWSNPLQLITVTDIPLIPPTVAEYAIVTFTPRYDHRSVGGIGGGSGDDFPVPIPHSNNTAMSQLLARVVLTEPFTKSNTETLTVIWIIYFKRVT